MCDRHLGPLNSLSIHLGGVYLKIVGYTHLYLKLNRVLINHQKGGRLKVHLGPNCFGDNDKHNLRYLMVN
jgi:FKBP-type peptidyl-prolyl cis-trans isomerase 2